MNYSNKSILLSRLKKHLVKQPTPFAWVILILVLAMLFYLVLGLIVMMKTAEGVMALLVVPFLAPFVIGLALADYFFRRILSHNLRKILIVEAMLILGWGGWLGYTSLSKTQFITERITPLVIAVEAGDHPKRSWSFNRNIMVDSSNIVFVSPSVDIMDWGKLAAKTSDGKTYRQIYPMYYRETDSINCNGRKYAIQFFMLESDSIPHFVFGEKQFDSIKVKICDAVGSRL